MNIPRFWASSDPQKAFLCWHWSNNSVEEASRLAAEKSRRLESRWKNDEFLGRYPYGNGAIREEVIQRLPREDGGAAALITRNPYGSLVLNTRNIMFIDIDFPPSITGGWLRGRRAKRDDHSEFQQAAIKKLQTVVIHHRDLGIRLYRTCGGLRGLVTTRLFEPADPKSIALLQTAGSDPLYIRLCQSQACFRARLTAKPWRAGRRTPPSRFPFTTDMQLAAYRRWESAYTQAVARFSVCRLLQQVGPEGILPEIHPVMELHDRLTEAGSNKPLA